MYTCADDKIYGCQGENSETDLESGRWARIFETIEFCRRMNYRKIGIAFCRETREKAKGLVKILQECGFHVVAVMCAPLLQATLLNAQETDFNLALGLCVDRDALFYKYSKAMVTTVDV